MEDHFRLVNRRVLHSQRGRLGNHMDPLSQLEEVHPLVLKVLLVLLVLLVRVLLFYLEVHVRLGIHQVLLVLVLHRLQSFL